MNTDPQDEITRLRLELHHVTVIHEQTKGAYELLRRENDFLRGAYATANTVIKTNRELYMRIVALGDSLASECTDVAPETSKAWYKLRDSSGL